MGNIDRRLIMWWSIRIWERRGRSGRGGGSRVLEGVRRRGGMGMDVGGGGGRVGL